MDVVDRDRTDRAADPAPGPAPTSRVHALLLLLLGSVAVLSAVVLPLAPVQMSVPTVSWPDQPGRAVPTMLELTNQEPLALDVEFSCATVRAAERTDDGVVLSTLRPESPAAAVDGLVVTARDGELRVISRGATVVAEPIADGSCSYRIVGDRDGLVVERDGTTLGTAPAQGDFDVLPDVDVLTSSVGTLSSEADLRVRLTVDNQFNTTPTVLKQVLVGLGLLAAMASLVALWLVDRRFVDLRRTDLRPGSEGLARPAVAPVGLVGWLVDVVVVGVLLLWWFIAPYSDDDGYYAAMARNAELEGFVGNYYQLLNQSFTPFTWFYRLLGEWTEVGDSAVVLRVPALLVGLGTWVLLRRLVTRPGALPEGAAGQRTARRGVVVLAAAAFLAWWLPYGMGVRPEAVVGFLALVTFSAVLAALRRERLLPIGIAIGAASLAATCHPTGLVSLAPILVALPRLVGLVRATATSWLEVAARTALVLAPGVFGGAAAFADGSLNDFLRGQQIFLSVQGQNSWYDEIQRYNFLLGPIPMGSYARRAAVLLGVLALLWFLVVAVAARAGGARLPAHLLLAGQSLAVAFLLLWVTPSKWTHHFGALAGLGPLFLALFLVGLPALVRQVSRGRSTGSATPLLALGSLVVVVALALHGPNSWAYSWLPGLPYPGVPPRVSVLELGSPLLWAGVAVLAVGVARRVRRGRPGPAWPVAVPLVVLTFLVVSLGYLIGTFSVATLRTVDGYSPWADSLTDPLARNCAAASAIEVSELAAARPLVAETAPETDAPQAAEPAFVDGGWFPASPPPGSGTGVGSRTWGSLSAPGAEQRTGTITTGWFPLPDLEEGREVAVLAAGRLGDGNLLRVEYAATGADGDRQVLGEQVLDDGRDAAYWRTFLLDPEAVTDGGAADSLRLVADDRSGGPGGWLAFTVPSVVPMVSLAELVPDGAPVAEAWQVSWLFPCQRQPDVRFGITEPARYGILWRPGPAANGLDDNTWQVFRGGLFAPVQRTSAVAELAVVVPSAPGLRDLQVFRFDLPYDTEAYDLTVDRVTLAGWAGPRG